MPGLFRKVTKRFFIVFNVIFGVLFLLACANSFLPPKTYWFIALLGLVFPVLLVLMIGFLIFWTVMRSRWAFLSLFLLLFGWFHVRAFYAFNLKPSFKEEKKPGSLRVITWNVHYLDQMYRPNQQKQSQREPITNFLKQQNADVICMQEFFESQKPQFLANIEFMKKEFGMPYHFFVDDYRQPKNVYQVGPVIFSKYPIVSTNRNEYSHSSLNAVESLINADIDVNGTIVRVYTTHLQSVVFRKKEYRNIERIKNVEDSLLEASRSIVNKLKQAYTFRGGQARLVRQELNKCPYPLIVCGDFNDVPNSFTYFHIKGDLQDAFLQRGFGIGRTYASLSPTLRIDYMFASRDFKVLQCKKVELPFSDHYPVIADLELAKQ
ncbi:MAG TPA: endonuclease/exonuclease/phosphatase family protein [Chitinophagaceae bacterium]|nr:endonuclease/exonuclease/phosphatase family protein [Chitinophagaceae bacterium]